MANQYTSKHDLKTLPEWAKQQIITQQMNIEYLQQKMQTIQNMNAIMCEPKRDWFTLPFSYDNYDSLKLWTFLGNEPTLLCSLGKGDLVFVGRSVKDAE